ncbi:MAG: NAD(P) transhydrogenase subunit beta [Candidatus Hydrogenedentes bacterium ADurb.Bin101]|jgi:NAD(P) transhydrogenase subunit beta|nr:MAG: NAD(P) transhydrogenase subunit beta [Candidatus Hydrogenedentes bacterium ADurb.Bin101]HOC70243.1 NAD(P)(+) transhydrogenase (Re/Si-specific) subunit beta [Candidatus Hydrogenedentota bacterium]
MYTVIELSYIASAVLFIFGLKMLGKPATAVRGNKVSAVGMLIAVVATLLYEGMDYKWILLGMAIGGVIGTVAAVRVPMTSMPEFVALFNGTGGLASLLVGWAEYNTFLNTPGGTLELVPVIAIYLAVLIGGVTFTGSMIAYAKLAERIDGRPVLYKGQQIVNGVLLALLLFCGVVYIAGPGASLAQPLFYLAVLLSLVLGVLVTIPIGGADMPVVISLLNSYSGLAACAAGFVISNTVLIVAGALVGASGIILTGIMCKAMNRSLTNVLFSGFGAAGGAAAAGKAATGEVKAITAEDAYYVLEAAGSVVFVPGYGMAVAQAQHAVRELGDLLEQNGAEVKYAVHPVAGRMPGHMNVLLAEANVPYEQLVEMEDINPTIESVDVCVVIGANDVVNPAAREDETSPIYGMPIINVDLARSCFVLKRSMRSGFAGVENPLFYKENTRMLFGDAKASITTLVDQFKSA